MTLRVLLADDQAMVRTGFRLILEREAGVEVVAEAENGEQAVTLAQRLRPDVTLMDIRMPVIDGLTATRTLAGPDVEDPLRVLVVTTFDLDELVHEALCSGACGFLLKDAGPGLLVEAVHAAANGEALVSPSITTRLLAHFTASPLRSRTRRADPELSRRELEVAMAVARGRTNAEIAVELTISLSTVKTHLASIQRKITARNRTEIAVWAWETGVVTGRTG
ncbi:DNA-binding response regulator, NarL/FixJ family, contains REC and HTH domains [Amycolatopsis xylanica]|uniref:DNA-binding response regulator, NarL/FixJ family, contains REC and HTH domains n=1 Tax=Amycolatopsis xylanica TaxID=589385 RepID=A0A1H2U664_9PSEU|nr:response regulator transcription factor [Amycolatopsis xylanica]SDW51530.1 DNA-binding response regulator, NarL/FixJ family, contains REC and HTH domains [Amycolatopsis xylanica]